ncbi:uncharacterized protein BXZ73DRAFT_74996 [Epithele typhae]|uniref:uncharacterized protein n=1 Tax=Epithele typhae TaxID=378194 RepID=UPI0020080CB6|nr:uncharacterized protein BXZ73DRAFT_74996 [Epithele typhae]KAH9941815.1 hypothetical protein BXZ73DRAFT_74996 [Epithele typhae]
MLPFLLAAILLPSANAQGTDAVCLTGFAWMDNSLGQSPCLMTSYLYTPCYGNTGSNITALHSGFVYTGATSPATGTDCVCSTVTFSVLAACAACQGFGLAIDPWPKYSNFCTNSFIEKYPFDIPTGTAIPAWAFMDIPNTANGTLDLALAEKEASSNLPESTPPASSSTTASSSSTTSTNPSTTTQGDTSTTRGGGPSSSSPSSAGSTQTQGTNGDPNANSPPKSSNAGPIAGGVVGGLAVLGLAGGAVFYFLRKRQQPAYGAGTWSGPDDQMGQRYGTEPAVPVTPNPFAGGAVVESQPMLYDPNDPRTFPNTSGQPSDESSYGQPHAGPLSANHGYTGSGHQPSFYAASMGGAPASASQAPTSTTFPSTTGYTGRPEI